MGPITPPTNDDEKYALNVLDEHSEMSATILLKSKTEASKDATNLLTQWQNQNECKVKFIRTDNGTEFSGLDNCLASFAGSMVLFMKRLHHMLTSKMVR
jgi:IS30 family transposase